MTDTKKSDKKETKKDLDNNEMMTAILSYLGILVLIPLFAIEKDKRNDFIKYHLEQGLNLFIIEIILWVIVMILTPITFGIFAFVGYLINLFILIVCIIAIIKAVNKEKWEIPVISNIKMVKL